MEEEISSAPGFREVHGSDLQKGFHEVLSSRGDTEALKFLLENYDKNPRFAERQALKMSVGLNERLQELFFQSSVDEVRANLHDEFKKMDGKQQTKVGGYKGFIQEYLSRIETEVGEFLPEEQRYNTELLKDSPVFKASSAHFMPETVTVDGEADYYWSKNRTSFRQLSDSRLKMVFIKEIIKKGGEREM